MAEHFLVDMKEIRIILESEIPCDFSSLVLGIFQKDHCLVHLLQRHIPGESDTGLPLEEPGKIPRRDIGPCRDILLGNVLGDVLVQETDRIPDDEGIGFRFRVDRLQFFLDGIPTLGLRWFLLMFRDDRGKSVLNGFF